MTHLSSAPEICPLLSSSHSVPHCSSVHIDSATALDTLIHFRRSSEISPVSHTHRTPDCVFSGGVCGNDLLLLPPLLLLQCIIFPPLLITYKCKTLLPWSRITTTFPSQGWSFLWTDSRKSDIKICPLLNVYSLIFITAATPDLCSFFLFFPFFFFCTHSQNSPLSPELINVSTPISVTELRRGCARTIYPSDMKHV